ncbi:hypothetical protein E0L36_22080 [Streptomyces sp. AJS327]|uniref:hypothetical protein n=1 Tax=Streptomyces sp. AJS327 TaxID=2545265 RepID=UPI0015DD774E|nr:hypothetical protein [Streptomyces sp. AJS327]MBA0053466.1 hypothetical protein [Streptomyces sp. AJS327]
MGAIQEPTTTMGPYRTEIRSESFYLTVSGPTATPGARRVDRQTLSVPAAHAPFILAALDQVTAHNGWKDWNGTRRTGAITVTRDGDELLLRVDEPVYAQEWNDEDRADTSVSTEIGYEDVGDLREQVKPCA